VILCVGYKRRQIQKYVGKGRKWGLQVKYSVEKKLLGTGGAVKNAERLIPDKRLLVINGDTFLDLNLQEMIKFHRSREALATIATVRVADQQRYGSLNMDRAKRITAFLEKREIHEIDKLKEATRPVNAGIYVFEKRLLGEIRPGKATSLEKEIFPYLIAGKKLYCFTTNAYFIDIGIPNDFRRAQDEFPERFGIDAHC
jgi:mannose-1-phosphate guanylyltransferase